MGNDRDMKQPRWYYDDNWVSVGASENIVCKDCVFRPCEIAGTKLDRADTGSCQKYPDPKNKPDDVYFKGASCKYYQRKTEDNEKHNEDRSLYSRICSTIIGGAVGDALGVPVEFKRRGTFKVTDMIGHGTYNQPKGTWSDDTSLTLCLIETICEDGDESALMRKFSEYQQQGYMTPHNECFDIGGTTARAIEAYRRGVPPDRCGQAGENDNGNGALMRIAPVVFLNINDNDIHSRSEKIERYSKFTHAHPRSMFGCILYVEFLRQLYLGNKKDEAINAVVAIATSLKEYEKQFPHYDRILKGTVKMLGQENIKSGGYVVDTLEAAIWCFLKQSNFKDTILEAVNLGGDTDTTGIVAGSLAGMYYGTESIPNAWVNTLARINDIKEFCRIFAEKVAS